MFYIIDMEGAGATDALTPHKQRATRTPQEPDMTFLATLVAIFALVTILAAVVMESPRGNWNKLDEQARKINARF